MTIKRFDELMEWKYLYHSTAEKANYISKLWHKCMCVHIRDGNLKSKKKVFWFPKLGKKQHSMLRFINANFLFMCFALGSLSFTRSEAPCVLIWLRLERWVVPFLSCSSKACRITSLDQAEDAASLGSAEMETENAAPLVMIKHMGSYSRFRLVQLPD